MNYRHYTTEDFILDNFFRQWVQQPDKESSRFWHEWIKEHPEKFDTLNQARYILQHLHFEVPYPEEKDYLEIRRKIKQEIQNSNHQLLSASPAVKSPVHRLTRWRHAAAFFTGVAMLGILYFFFLREPQPIVYATDYGEIEKIVLPDSSVVTLNANSTLTLASDWHQSREVWLEGEAFFVVKKMIRVAANGNDNSAQAVKFVVHTDNLDVEVLGTRFNVNERRGMTKVVLNSGSVQIKNTDNEEIVKMQPGDLVAYSKSEKKLRKKAVNPRVFTAWKEGRFAFDGMPIKDIAQMLEDTYGYKVSIKNEAIASRKFTAEIPSHDVQTLLTLIAESLEVKAEKINNEIIIKN